MRVYALAEGNVQGVGYRGFVRRTAHALGVKGFVRNLSDGRVEVYCIGRDEAHLKKFLQAIERKSNSFFGIHVERLHVFKENEPGFKSYGDFQEFEVQF